MSDSNKLFQDEFTSAFNFASIGMALVSTTGDWLMVNPAICKMIGYSEEELMKLTFQDITHPDDLDEDLKYVKEMLEGTRDTYEMEKRYFRKDGETIYVLLSVSLVRNENGEPKYFISQIQNITERKNAKERADLVLDHTFDAYWDWNFNTADEYLSPRFWEMFGYPVENGKKHFEKWQEIIFPVDLEIAQEKFKDHVESKGRVPFYFEARFRHKNGSTVWVISKGNVVEWNADETPRRMVGTLTDITELKRRKTEVINNAKLASLGRLAGGIAHEINNPLAIISSNATLLKNMAERDKLTPALAVKTLDNVLKTVDRAAKIITGLKKLVRNEGGGAVSMDLYGSIDSVVAVFTDRLKQSKVNVTNDVPKEARVTFDEVQFSQVILNLLQNAVDEIGKQDNPWVRFSAKQVNGEWELLVTDSGAGIPPEVASRIMEPFYTTKRVGKGTGLGLSICRQIIQNFGGDLAYDPTVENTTFVVRFGNKKNTTQNKKAA